METTQRPEIVVQLETASRTTRQMETPQTPTADTTTIRHPDVCVAGLTPARRALRRLPSAARSDKGPDPCTASTFPLRRAAALRAR